jgi:hypothetical protein
MIFGLVVFDNMLAQLESSIVTPFHTTRDKTLIEDAAITVYQAEDEGLGCIELCVGEIDCELIRWWVCALASYFCFRVASSLSRNAILSSWFRCESMWYLIGRLISQKSPISSQGYVAQNLDICTYVFPFALVCFLKISQDVDLVF